MKTIVNSYIKENGWELRYEWGYSGRCHQGIIECCIIFIKTGSAEFLKIGQFERDGIEECLILYYRLPWIVMNKIYKYLDEEEDE